MRKTLTALALAATAALLSVSLASANPSPPTNGGNGGGSSGQCTGRADERPSGCHTSKGVDAPTVEGFSSWSN